jgi:cell wall-associated NlpC family hydrolase
MRLLTEPGIAVVVSAFSLLCWPQPQNQQTPTENVHNAIVSAEQAHGAESRLSSDDRLSLIAAALDAKAHLGSGRDCSHLVHAIYQGAGFPYRYVPSSDLYRGVDGFERINLPEPGDLIAWRGHVGIVIKPSERLFFSYMRAGPGIDDWGARYWKKRGQLRFYRYIKSWCESCDSEQYRGRPLVRVKQKR